MSQKDDERARRLAESLRANLKRRKAQDRAREAEATPPISPPSPPAPPRSPS